MTARRAKRDPQERAFLAAIKEAKTDADADAAHAAYADWLEERGRDFEAAKEREKAGRLTLRYELRDRRTGEVLYSDYLQGNLTHAMTPKRDFVTGRRPEMTACFGRDPEDVVVAVVALYPRDVYSCTARQWVERHTKIRFGRQ